MVVVGRSLPDADSIQPTCVLCNCIYREDVFLRKCVKHQKKKEEREKEKNFHRSQLIKCRVF